MKNFENWGIKIRRDIPRNYYAVWENLETTRLDLGGDEIKLPYGESEFYDVGITSRCNAQCPFCYVSSGPTGEDGKDICRTWASWMDSLPEDIIVDPAQDPVFRDILAPPTKDIEVAELRFKLKILESLKKTKGKVVYTNKPFQASIGSTGEPTIHPDFSRFLQTVYESGVVPNYTTNGVYLSPEILEATRNFVGGVAVSWGNKTLRPKATDTIKMLLKSGECKVMIHHLISDIPSVDDFLGAVEEWGADIHYHVLLPLKKHGRSKEEMTEEAYLYLTSKIREKGLENLAFGMWFLPWLQKFPGSLKVWDYPAETYSSNALISDGKVVITPSSYDLTPVLT